MKLRFKIIALVVFFTGVMVTACSPGPSFDYRLRDITRTYRFDIVRWEVSAIGGLLQETFTIRYEEPESNAGVVLDYFADTGQHGELRQSVESTIEAQIREVLSQQGISNPLTESKISFPPVEFVLSDPPHLLVVSPRDRIESIRKITLLPEMSLSDMDAVEEQVDGLGVSSLVVQLGGIATYPSFVLDSDGLRFAIDTAVEEWLHQYLAFTPLGFRYLLDTAGIRRNYEIATMNETLAGIVSEEIGAMVYEKYYAADDADKTAPDEETSGGFDFNRSMREIRQAVDGYLARGEVEQAEAFMEQQRQYLLLHGYNIRKLNQAYFAFYGTYADEPTSISPIGKEMTLLREKSSSLKDFLDRASAMTSRQDLTGSVQYFRD